MRWLSVMAAKATPEPKRRNGARPKRSEGPEDGGNFVLREELALGAKGKIVASEGFWAATAAIGRNAMQTEADARQGERCEKTWERIQTIGMAGR